MRSKKIPRSSELVKPFFNEPCDLSPRPLTCSSCCILYKSTYSRRHLSTSIILSLFPLSQKDLLQRQWEKGTLSVSVTGVSFLNFAKILQFKICTCLFTLRNCHIAFLYFCHSVCLFVSCAGFEISIPAQYDKIIYWFWTRLRDLEAYMNLRFYSSTAYSSPLVLQASDIHLLHYLFFLQM